MTKCNPYAEALAQSIQIEFDNARKNPRWAIGRALQLTPVGRENPFEVERWVMGKPSIFDATARKHNQEKQ